MHRHRAYIFDLDGVLTPDRGGRAGSLHDMVHDRDYRPYSGAGLRIRVDKYVAKIGQDNYERMLARLKALEGSVHVLTYNLEEAAQAYLEPLLPRLETSIFAPDVDKCDVWNAFLDDIERAHPGCEFLYFDDDAAELEEIKAADKHGATFRHVTEWLGGTSAQSFLCSSAN